MFLSPLKNEGKGYTRKLNAHFNFGSGKGGGNAASYTIVDPDGLDVAGLHEQYDTRKGGMTGFFFAGIDRPFDNWWDAVAYWPTAAKLINDKQLPKRRRSVSEETRTNYRFICEARELAERIAADRARGTSVSPEVQADGPARRAGSARRGAIRRTGHQGP